VGRDVDLNSNAALTKFRNFFRHIVFHALENRRVALIRDGLSDENAQVKYKHGLGWIIQAVSLGSKGILWCGPQPF